MYEEFNYCQHCGGPLSLRDVEGTERPCCQSCGWVLYVDPKVVVAVVLVEDGEVLLVKRGTGLGIGKWSFPSGFVDRGEVVEVAAARETLEETGLDVRIERLLGVYSEERNPVILVMYEGVALGGDLKAGDDVQDVGWFPLDDLPPLAFPHDARLLDAWRKEHEVPRGK